MTVVTPTTRKATASNPTIAATSLVRNDQLAGPRGKSVGGFSVGRFEDISGPAQCVDHRLPTGVDFLSQVRDIELDDIGLATEVVVPYPVQDLALGQHPARITHQIAKQLELGRGQLDEIAGAAHLMAVLIEGEVAHSQRRV